MSKAKLSKLVRKNLKSRVTVDAELAELLNDAGHYRNNDIDAVWAACHVLMHLGLVDVIQKGCKMKGGTETLLTEFSTMEKLRTLMIENGQLP